MGVEPVGGWPNGCRVGDAIIRQASDSATNVYTIEFDDLPGTELTIIRDMSGEVKPWIWADDPTLLALELPEAVRVLRDIIWGDGADNEDLCG